MEPTPGIRPRPSLWRRLDGAARHSFPAATAAFGLILIAGPLGLPGQAALGPAFALAAVFFWSLYRPASMGPLVVFLLGLLGDILGQTPPGVLVLVLLLTHGVAVRWRRVLVRLGFLLVWFAFATLAAGVTVLFWLLCSALALRPMPLPATLLQFGLTVGLYPALALLFIRAHRGVAAPERA
ncbi:MAG: hypothetical protein ACP5NI_05885 [Acetobacteraceae bacterium]